MTNTERQNIDVPSVIKQHFNTPDIFKAIPRVMSEIGAIGKDRTNKQQNYQFRGIDDVYNAINAALVKHGVFCVPNVLSMKREERESKTGGVLLYTILDVEFTLYASDGSCVKGQTVGEAMDSGDKSCNKAMSAAHKYFFLETFCIPTIEPKDTENETHEVAPKTKKAEFEEAKKELDKKLDDARRFTIITSVKKITHKKAPIGENILYTIHGEKDRYSSHDIAFATLAKTAKESDLKVSITHKTDKDNTIETMDIVVDTPQITEADLKKMSEQVYEAIEVQT